MDQTQFNKLFKSGDAGATWAYVENGIAQALSGLQAQHDKAIAGKDALLKEKTEAMTALQQSLDKKTAELALATKPEREKKQAIFDAQIAELKAQRDALA